MVRREAFSGVSDTKFVVFFNPLRDPGPNSTSSPRPPPSVLVQAQWILRQLGKFDQVLGVVGRHMIRFALIDRNVGKIVAEYPAPRFPASRIVEARWTKDHPRHIVRTCQCRQTNHPPTRTDIRTPNANSRGLRALVFRPCPRFRRMGVRQVLFSSLMTCSASAGFLAATKGVRLGCWESRRKAVKMSSISIRVVSGWPSRSKIVRPVFKPM